MNKASTYDESIFDLYVEEKLTMKEVADTLGISVGKVFNRLKVMGVHSRGHKDYPASAEVDGKKTHTIYLQQPFQNPPDFTATSINYDIQYLVRQSRSLFQE